MYDGYLKEILKVIESDENIRKKMEEASLEDIRSGKISKEINFLPYELREKLNEIKKEEIHRLRKLVQAKNTVEKGGRVRRSQYMKEIADHLDHNNPHSFEASDLTNLIKAATKDLDTHDQEREDEFKKMEMEQEMRRKEKLKKLNEADKKKAEEEYMKQMQENVEKHKTNHPGSRAQLEEVWKEEDGLEDQEFNPKTFFRMHDQNGDGFLDQVELEALFTKDLDQAYSSMKDEHKRDVRMEEEKRRMRNHVLKEVDINKDKMVSLDEFMRYTDTKEFDTPEKDSYKSIDELLLEHALYTATELDKYRDEIKRQEDEIRRKLDTLKEEAKALGNLRQDIKNEKQEKLNDGEIDATEASELEAKKEIMKAQEEKVQTLHKELQQQSKDVVEMKRKVKTHERSEKVITGILDNIDKQPEDTKQAYIEKAHKELEKVKEAQAAVENKDVKDLKFENVMPQKEEVNKAEQESKRQMEVESANQAAQNLL